ncbi:hypothetical protein ABKN59_009886 [Abortiporus biennis]
MGVIISTCSRTTGATRVMIYATGPLSVRVETIAVTTGHCQIADLEIGEALTMRQEVTLHFLLFVYLALPDLIMSPNPTVQGDPKSSTVSEQCLDQYSVL